MLAIYRPIKSDYILFTKQLKVTQNCTKKKVQNVQKDKITATNRTPRSFEELMRSPRTACVTFLEITFPKISVYTDGVGIPPKNIKKCFKTKQY